MPHRLTWIRCMLVMLGLWTGAGHFAVWSGGRLAMWGTTRAEVPLGQGRSIGVRVVDPSAYGFRGLIDSVPLHPPEPLYRSLEISLRYRATPQTTGLRFAVYDVPSWPLLPISGGVLLAFLLTFIPRRLRESVVSR